MATALRERSEPRQHDGFLAFEIREPGSVLPSLACSLKFGAGSPTFRSPADAGASARPKTASVITINTTGLHNTSERLDASVILLRFARNRQ